MKIISYFTRLTPYEQVANEFIIPSVKKWNLSHDIKAIKDLGSWQLNTGYKATFIKEMLLKHKEPIVFIDCDGEIVKYPELLYKIPDNIDIGYFHFNWFHHWRNQPENTSNIQLLSGTMYFNYSEKVLLLIDEWIKNVEENTHEWEQKTLQNIVYTRNDLNIYKLPAEYCTVLMHDYSLPKYVIDPIIIHWQRSRLYKNRRSWND